MWTVTITTDPEHGGNYSVKAAAHSYPICKGGQMENGGKEDTESMLPKLWV